MASCLIPAGSEVTPGMVPEISQEMFADTCHAVGFKSSLDDVLNDILPGFILSSLALEGARCSSVLRAFTHGAVGRRIDPSWGGPIELFLVPSSDPRLV